MDLLRNRNSVNLCLPRSDVCDLRNPLDVEQLFTSQQPQIVIHLAATVGGIQFNQQHPADCLHDNLQMGLNVLRECHKTGVEKLVLAGTTCSYPNYVEVPFKETDIWNGYPEKTNAPYGLAKRLLIEAAKAYRLQHGLQTVSLVLANLYGPGDNFEPDKSHVVPALIKKFVEANGESVCVWGTGRASREFLHVRDAARAVVLAADQWWCNQLINIGSGREIMISGLAGLIGRLTGYTGNVWFDGTKPDGQPRRRLDVTMAQTLGFEAEIELEDGMKETIRWYKDAQA
jgi:GDP-L-fucose synthase